MKHRLSAAFALVVISIFGMSTTKAEITECTEISVLPATITTQGVYCLKKNLVTAITSGSAITINANNVTIDLNGWKLGGAAAGAGTNANGIYALDRNNITIRNGSVRGFRIGINLDLSDAVSGHLVEDIRADGNREVGIFVRGDNITVRNNQVLNTGNSTPADNAYAIRVGGGAGVIVQGNTISGVEETSTIGGIRLADAVEAQVLSNNVSGLTSTSGNIYGIFAGVGSIQAVLSGNRIINHSLGTNGIRFLGSQSADCINNYVQGYSTALAGCDYSSGNDTP